MKKIKKMVSLKHDRNATLKTVVGMVFAAALVIFIFWFFYNLYAAMFGGGADKGTVSNFELVQEDIEALLNDPSTPQSINYFLAADYFFVGFDKDWDDSAPTWEISRWYWWDGEGSLEKPVSCYELACVCLYKDDAWLFTERVERDEEYRCRAFDYAKNIKFVAKDMNDVKNARPGEPNTYGGFGLPRSDVPGTNYLFLKGVAGPSMKDIRIEVVRESDSELVIQFSPSSVS